MICLHMGVLHCYGGTTLLKWMVGILVPFGTAYFQGLCWF